MIKDFSDCFNRGEQLLAVCPDQVMDSEQRLAMAERLVEGRKAITATRALLEASPEAMAVSMGAMSPWHQLMTEVWSLSARISEQLN